MAPAHRLAASALVMLATGCTLLAPPSVETRKHLLSEIPAHIPTATTLDARLLVLAPDAAPAYDTTAMAYTARPFEIGYFPDNEWADKPAAMLQTLVVETLRRTHRFSEVVAAPYFNGHHYALSLTLQEITQDYTQEPPAVRLSARFELSNERGDVIASKEIAQQEPMSDKTPYAGVVAANAAASKMLREAARFVIGETRERR